MCIYLYIYISFMSVNILKKYNSSVGDQTSDETWIIHTAGIGICSAASMDAIIQYMFTCT